MREGSLEAPTRHPIPWREEEFYDAEKLDAELRRVFDICHGCRRCFNLCDSFPRLFDLVDESETGELESVASADFKPVIDACTLCDMCYMTKCPYVPPHEFDLDFPHLMVRCRAQELKQGKIGFAEKQLTETDRNGRLGCSMHGLANWASKQGNTLTRPLMQQILDVHEQAALPPFTDKKLTAHSKPEVNTQAPAHGRKAVLYATCTAEYNNPDIGLAALQVLARNGVEAEVVYAGCCGMPQLEHGDLARVADSAATVSAALKPWIDKGYDVITPVASCGLMLKFEWPLIVPENKDVKLLSDCVFDISEYIIDIAKKEGLADGLTALAGDVVVHIACHARAQNMGQKAAELLKHLPNTTVTVIERCSGHGGAWGVMQDNFEVGLKVGKPVVRQAAKVEPAHVVSECPLARDHILQGMEQLDEAAEAIAATVSQDRHPVQLLARAYGF